VFLSTSALSAEAQACRSEDSVSRFMVNGVKRLMSASDSASVATRSRMQLPVVSPDSVVLVTNDSICSQMVSAYGGAISLPRSDGVVPSGQVYVVKVGTVYLVRDPVITGGNYTVEMVINTMGVVLTRQAS
jgi:hypothetical protein